MADSVKENSPRPLVSLSPCPDLINRARSELHWQGPLRISRAPGRLDVMGGIADYTGSMVCEMPLDRAAAVALQPRDDRNVQVFSFNLHDDNKPFTLQIPLDALTGSTEDLRREFNEPGRKFGGYIAGCLHILHREGFIDLHDQNIRGMNLAVLSTVSLGAGISSSAAIEVATMMAVMDHLNVRPITPDGPKNAAGVYLAALCQMVENQVVGAPCGIMDQVTSCCGRAGKLLRMICQPHELLEPLTIPAGMRVVGINSDVKHSVGGGQYGKTRCAAFMAHTIILRHMRDIGLRAGMQMTGDPMQGYLANLDANHYKDIFRRPLPEKMKGSDFLLRYGATIDTATKVDPDVEYDIQHAADHHVLEARRVKQFAEFIEEANRSTDPNDRGLLLDKAGHLMYASHLSYKNDALLGAEECDLLVDLARKRERAGIYGAKITGGGAGGTVAILCEISPRVDAALAEIQQEYHTKTGLLPELFSGTSEGAWEVGTELVQ